MAFPDVAPTSTSMSSVPKADLAPEAEIAEDDEEQSLPPREEEAAKLRFDEDQASLAAGRAAIVHYAKVAPSRPGVYRMLDARGDVLYVGKAKNVKKRIAAYARPTGLDTRSERVVPRSPPGESARTPPR